MGIVTSVGCERVKREKDFRKWVLRFWERQGVEKVGCKSCDTQRSHEKDWVVVSVVGSLGGFMRRWNLSAATVALFPPHPTPQTKRIKHC